MNAGPDVERLIADWLHEEAPGRAPDRVLEAAGRSIDRMHKRRSIAEWRLPQMNRFGLAIAAIATVVAVVVGGSYLFGSGPGPGASQTPSAEPSQTPIGPTPTPLARNLSGWLVFEHFGQAPDGSTTEFNAENRMIWLVHLDGTGLHELAPGAPPDGKANPDISPNGSTVIFSSWTPRSLIWEVNIDGGEPRPISTDCDGLGQPCAEGEPAYSPDGSKIAYARTTDAHATSEIAIRDLTTGAVTALPATTLSAEVGYVAQPTWSADGTQIVYQRTLQGPADESFTGASLFVINADGTGLHELPAPADKPAGDPDWSPDGTRIVFSTLPNRESEGIPGQGSIWTVQPDGSLLTQVCMVCFGGGLAPTWLSDGTKILFWGYRSWALIDPDGGNPRHIDQDRLSWFGNKLGYGYAGFLQPAP